MDKLLSNLRFAIHDKLYIKDPESSELGRRILEHSIILFDEVGFDAFTFKKLGLRIESNESSIYRYFENKHKLLLYLTSWYWGWIEYQLVFATNSIQNPEEKLVKAIGIVCRTTSQDQAFTHINEVILNRVIINEFSKSYLTKEVDEENKEGYFSIYKRLVHRLEEMIQAVNPEYPFAASLASTIVEGGLYQQFLKDHFTSITNCDNQTTAVDFFTHLALNTLRK